MSDKYMLTAGKLRKLLIGIPANTPIYIADHDHGTYETNSIARIAKLINQEDADPWDVDRLAEVQKITGPYFVIRP